MLKTSVCYTVSTSSHWNLWPLWSTFCSALHVLLVILAYRGVEAPVIFPYLSVSGHLGIDLQDRFSVFLLLLLPFPFKLAQCTIRSRSCSNLTPYGAGILDVVEKNPAVSKFWSVGVIALLLNMNTQSCVLCRRLCVQMHVHVHMCACGGQVILRCWCSGDAHLVCLRQNFSLSAGARDSARIAIQKPPGSLLPSSSHFQLLWVLGIQLRASWSGPFLLGFSPALSTQSL